MLLVDLMSISSVTGTERTVALALEAHLKRNFPAARVYRQSVSDNRWNVIMEQGAPMLTLSTHIDTVPGGPAPSFDRENLYGRGACDAKGQIVAQLWGLHQAVQNGVENFRCAYVVGEETDSIGARALMAMTPTPYILNGEPTRNRFASRSWGGVDIEVYARGTSAHSSLGTPDSAIHKLLDDLHALRASAPASIELNIGRIQGGTASNVQAGQARCDICARVRGGTEELKALLASTITRSQWREKSPPMLGLSLFVPPRYEAETCEVKFASDCSFYAPGYKHVMLFGPGTIAEAHTDNESIRRSDLSQGAAIIANVIESIEGTSQGAQAA
jgi:acetylornithine deacetylase